MKHFGAALLIYIMFASTGIGQTTARPLSDADVESMVRAGMSSDVILAKIRIDQCNFDTSVSALEDLQSAGVPQSIMLAMVQSEDRGRGDHRAAQSLVSTQPSKGLLLQDGTPVKLRFDETISSALVHANDRVAFDVSEPVAIDGTVVIPVGARAIGSVTSVQPKRRLGRSGKLTISLTWVRDVYGDKISLRATQNGSGGGRMALMAGGVVAAGAVFLPAAPLFLLVRGKDSIIPQGTIITGFVSHDTIVGGMLSK